jgi:hypothetical protein
MFACIAPAGGSLFEWTAGGAAQGVAWTPLTAPAKPFVTGGVGTGQACVNVSASTPARVDCFWGDGGLIPAPAPQNSTCINFQDCTPALWGLYWAPDDATRPVQIAMLESFQLRATPSCIGWGVGQIECFFPDKALSDLATIRESGATIWHVLSYNLDSLALREQTLIAANLARQGIVINPNFWQESLGVAAPTPEFGPKVGKIVNNPKTLALFACFKGPPFQSLCVAGLIASSYTSVQSLPSPTAAQLATYRTSRRLVFKLVGTPGVAPEQPRPPCPGPHPCAIRQPQPAVQ